ncbi:hypothetical protein SBA1_210008 [Candidatus Sulfotelmatobacter kueseliae]|uniref:Uncharacterized protein n=1 Tax=Candidatus Sulfotelmatobacter kueseliae TaxID=2042962 RepID=A0A2U3KGR0_9BACT|nr:hypothetical protein SBA1_210008 [Candidatus Sulfotelmatobacter kueseliae]
MIIAPFGKVPAKKIPPFGRRNTAAKYATNCPLAASNALALFLWRGYPPVLPGETGLCYN